MRAHAAIPRQPLALLVDPDDDLRRLYADVLRATYAVEEADDGRQALALALSRHPDIVVSETRLLGLDGFNLTRLLRTDRETRDIPVLILTRGGEEQTVRRAREAGASDVLVKPCMPQELMAAIQTQLARAHELRERATTSGDRAQELPAQSTSPVAETVHQSRQVMVKSHHRRDTTQPPTPPLALRCPSCDAMLRYVKSHIGGVSAKHSEQWDYFECNGGCGTFQYRQRTRKLRRV